jgi:hypothetical protein
VDGEGEVVDGGGTAETTDEIFDVDDGSRRRGTHGNSGKSGELKRRC